MAFRLSDFDWTDPTAKRFVKPGTFCEAIFYGNTTGWKDDLKVKSLFDSYFEYCEGASSRNLPI